MNIESESDFQSSKPEESRSLFSKLPLSEAVLALFISSIIAGYVYMCRGMMFISEEGEELQLIDINEKYVALGAVAILAMIALLIDRDKLHR